MIKNQPTILVYNPISGHGHLDSWNAMFIALLLKQGWRVLALTPDTSALLTRLARKNADLACHPCLQVLDWDAAVSRIRFIVRFRNSLRDAWKRWDTFGDRYCYRRPGSETTPDMSFAQYGKTRLFQITVPPLFRASHFLYSRYRRARTKRSELPTDDPERDLTCPVDMARRVQAALKKANRMPTLAFNMYMDTYRTAESEWRAFAAINKLFWAGIRFVPPEAPQEAWYTLPAWRGMCFLDENACRAHAAVLANKCFGYLPDITETTLPDVPGTLAQEIRQRARGRKIVFLGGSIGGQKNLARWFELIALANSEQWFFVQIGEIHRDTLTTEDRAALDRIQNAPPENLLLQAEYLPDEPAFNEVIAACDVIFAVYRNFSISSNMLGKAAHFRKPILVSDRYLMGRRVRHYRIGLAVDETDTASILTGLSDIVRQPVFTAESFEAYCSDFSHHVLAKNLEAFLKICCNDNTCLETLKVTANRSASGLLPRQESI